MAKLQAELNAVPRSLDFPNLHYPAALYFHRTYTGITGAVMKQKGRNSAEFFFKPST